MTNVYFILIVIETEMKQTQKAAAMALYLATVQDIG